MTQIMNHFPLPVPRPQQVEALLALESAWHDYDVFVVNLPVGTGKSAISQTLLSWTGSGIVCTPTNNLVQQYLGEFSNLCTMWKRSTYQCPVMHTECTRVARRGRLRECLTCQYTQDLARIKSPSTPAVVNYYTYLAHRLYRPLVVFDEAHNLVNISLDLAAQHLWQDQYEFPKNLRTYLDLVEWLEGKAKLDPKCKKLQKVLLSDNKNYMLRYDTGYRRGRQLPVLKLIPLDARDESPKLWPPNKVKKLVLMSATIGPEDIYTLGLDRKRVCYISTDSPILPACRPICVLPVASMNYQYQVTNTPRIAAKINDLLAKHATKGVIHCTYSVAALLKNSLDNSRLMWHTRESARTQYAEFLASPETEGKVLVACGMSEGIDLKDGCARWQVIAKVPYPSKADPAVTRRAEDRPQWYVWQTVKQVLQTSGRVCRGPEDHGITYILDTSFVNLYEQNKDVFPLWFRQAVINRSPI
jgi:Rad3-related DNA helicase